MMPPLASLASAPPPAAGEGASPSGAGSRRRLPWLPHRRHRPARPSVNPAVVEEEAADLLYGERTGTVHASPTVPPIVDGDA